MLDGTALDSCMRIRMLCETLTRMQMNNMVDVYIFKSNKQDKQTVTRVMIVGPIFIFALISYNDLIC